MSLIGAGVFLGRGVFVGSHVEIGSFDSVNTIELAEKTRVESKAIIFGPAYVGIGVRIGPGVHITGPLSIGAGTEIFDHAVIGTPGQYPGRHDADGSIEIGSGLVIREYVCIARPVITGLTTVGDGCYLMSRTQVDHDCRLGRFVKTGCGVTLGGTVRVDDHAYLGMNAVAHQGVRIGAHSMIGMNGVITRDAPPYAVIVDRKVRRINAHGLRLRGASEADVSAIESAYAALRRGEPADTLDAADPWIAVLRNFFEETGADPRILLNRGPA
jgi:UDP-N-acetylglucosamine acyltransferase